MLELQRALALAAKVREYNELADIDPKLLGQIVKGAEEEEGPLKMLNEAGLKEIEEWTKKHG
jgi:hypothetical protein